MLRWFPLLAIALVGCGSESHPLMPLEVGDSVTYTVRSGFDTRVETVSVTRRLPVAGTQGAELSGPLGSARLAWRDGILYADTAANAQFEPPLPMLAEDGKDRTWHGRVRTLGREQPGSAVITQRKEKIRIGSRDVETVHVTHRLRLARADIELDTWYQPGVGVVQQEQRTKGQRVLQMQQLR